MINAVRLIQYNTWANRKLAEQAKVLSNDLFSKELGGSFPSIQLTLRHLLESDWIWLHRWKGIPLVEVPQDWQTDNVLALITLWSPIQDQVEEVVKELATEPERAIVFTNKSGASFSLPFIDTAIHSTNHGTYHRGQIVNMLRMLGEKSVSTDYFIFCNLYLK